MAATNPLTYNAYVTQVATLAIENTTTVNSVVQGIDDPFNQLIPSMLDYAELRIQRDVDLLPLQSSSGYNLVTGNNIFQVPVGDFVTVQTLSINGAPLTPTSKEFIQNVFGSNATRAQPIYFAPYGGDMGTAGNTSTNIMLGPYPDTTYPVTVTGTIRMPSLYNNATPAFAGTATTFISTWLPDMLIQASMIYISQFQRNFGQASNDPQMGPTFELQYQNLLKGALVEEARKRFAAGAWSSMGPTPLATPTR